MSTDKRLNITTDSVVIACWNLVSMGITIVLKYSSISIWNLHCSLRDSEWNLQIICATILPNHSRLILQRNCCNILTCTCLSISDNSVVIVSRDIKSMSQRIVSEISNLNYRNINSSDINLLLDNQEIVNDIAYSTVVPLIILSVIQ